MSLGTVYGFGGSVKLFDCPTNHMWRYWCGKYTGKKGESPMCYDQKPSLLNCMQGVPGGVTTPSKMRPYKINTPLPAGQTRLLG